MNQVDLGFKHDAPHTILCLGAHCDDIEIGCGGTLLKLLDQYPNVHVCWVVFSSNPARAEEARNCAHLFLEKAASKNIVIHSFRDGFFPHLFKEVKESFEELKKNRNPDVVFTHYRDDRHQDHRVISDLTWNTFRDHFVLEYEIPKYDGDLGVPNVFSHLDEATVQKKIAYMMESFPSQTNKDWFTEDTIYGLHRIRGVESRAPGKYAEAFYGRKITF